MAAVSDRDKERGKNVEKRSAFSTPLARLGDLKVGNAEGQAVDVKSNYLWTLVRGCTTRDKTPTLTTHLVCFALSDQMPKQASRQGSGKCPIDTVLGSVNFALNDASFKDHLSTETCVNYFVSNNIRGWKVGEGVVEVQFRASDLQLQHLEAFLQGAPLKDTSAGVINDRSGSGVELSSLGAGKKKKETTYKDIACQAVEEVHCHVLVSLTLSSWHFDPRYIDLDVWESFEKLCLSFEDSVSSGVFDLTLPFTSDLFPSDPACFPWVHPEWTLRRITTFATGLFATAYQLETTKNKLDKDKQSCAKKIQKHFKLDHSKYSKETWYTTGSNGPDRPRYATPQRNDGSNPHSEMDPDPDPAPAGPTTSEPPSKKARKTDGASRGSSGVIGGPSRPARASSAVMESTPAMSKRGPATATPSERGNRSSAAALSMSLRPGASRSYAGQDDEEEEDEEDEVQVVSDVEEESDVLPHDADEEDNQEADQDESVQVNSPASVQIDPERDRGKKTFVEGDLPRLESEMVAALNTMDDFRRWIKDIGGEESFRDQYYVEPKLYLFPFPSGPYKKLLFTLFQLTSLSITTELLRAEARKEVDQVVKLVKDAKMYSEKKAHCVHQLVEALRNGKSTLTEAWRRHVDLLAREKPFSRKVFLSICFEASNKPDVLNKVVRVIQKKTKSKSNILSDSEIKAIYESRVINKVSPTGDLIAVSIPISKLEAAPAHLTQRAISQERLQALIDDFRKSDIDKARVLVDDVVTEAVQYRHNVSIDDVTRWSQTGDWPKDVKVYILAGNHTTEAMKALVKRGFFGKTESGENVIPNRECWVYLRSELSDQEVVAISTFENQNRKELAESYNLSFKQLIEHIRSKYVAPEFNKPAYHHSSAHDFLESSWSKFLTACQQSLIGEEDRRKWQDRYFTTEMNIATSPLYDKYQQLFSLILSYKLPNICTKYDKELAKYQAALRIVSANRRDIQAGKVQVASPTRRKMEKAPKQPHREPAVLHKDWFVKVTPLPDDEQERLLDALINGTLKAWNAQVSHESAPSDLILNDDDIKRVIDDGVSCLKVRATWEYWCYVQLFLVRQDYPGNDVLSGPDTWGRLKEICGKHPVKDMSSELVKDLKNYVKPGAADMALPEVKDDDDAVDCLRKFFSEVKGIQLLERPKQFKKDHKGVVRPVKAKKLDLPEGKETLVPYYKSAPDCDWHDASIACSDSHFLLKELKAFRASLVKACTREEEGALAAATATNPMSVVVEHVHLDRPGPEDLILNGTGYNLVGFAPAEDRWNDVVVKSWHRFLPVAVLYGYPAESTVIRAAQCFITYYTHFVVAFGKSKGLPTMTTGHEGSHPVNLAPGSTPLKVPEIPWIGDPQKLQKTDDPDFVFAEANYNHRWAVHPLLRHLPSTLVNRWNELLTTFMEKVPNSDKELCSFFLTFCSLGTPDGYLEKRLVQLSGWHIRRDKERTDLKVEKAEVYWAQHDVLTPFTADTIKLLTETGMKCGVLVLDPPFGLGKGKPLDWDDKAWTHDEIKACLRNCAPLLTRDWTLIAFAPWEQLGTFKDVIKELHGMNYPCVVYSKRDKCPWIDGSRLASTMNTVIFAHFGEDKSEERWGFKVKGADGEDVRRLGDDFIRFPPPQAFSRRGRRDLDCITKDFKNAPVNDTQKSVEEIAWLIRHFSKPNMGVLSVCDGTGTTLIAALQENRSFAIGVDRLSVMVDASMSRVSEYCEAEKDRLVYLGLRQGEVASSKLLETQIKACSDDGESVDEAQQLAAMFAKSEEPAQPPEYVKIADLIKQYVPVFANMPVLEAISHKTAGIKLPLAQNLLKGLSDETIIDKLPGIQSAVNQCVKKYRELQERLTQLNDASKTPAKAAPPAFPADTGAACSSRADVFSEPGTQSALEPQSLADLPVSDSTVPTSIEGHAQPDIVMTDAGLGDDGTKPWSDGALSDEGFDTDYWSDDYEIAKPRSLPSSPVSNPKPPPKPPALPPGPPFQSTTVQRKFNRAPVQPFLFSAVKSQKESQESTSENFPSPAPCKSMSSLHLVSTDSDSYLPPTPLDEHSPPTPTSSVLLEFVPETPQ